MDQTGRGLHVLAICVVFCEQKSFSAPWRAMMTSMPVHALSVAHFVCMWGIYTNLSCLPQYYIQILAMDIHNVSCLLAMMLLLMIIMMCYGLTCA